MRGRAGALLLLLLDSRAPAGAHNHSGGMEAAVMAGLVGDLVDVEAFCRGRLATVGRVAADFAAAACRLHLGHGAGRQADAAAAAGPRLGWLELDAELDARTPSAAARAASRQLGSGLRRLLRSMLPAFDPPWHDLRPAPHHPLVLGAAVAAAGGSPDLAARAAALQSVTGPAGGAVRLLGLDPFAVQTLLARLADEIDEIDEIDEHDEHERDDLSAAAAPALDLLADFHLTTEVRLFAS
ncbi:urease accessory protein UreF [uncultured Jatrophihabitans sp.]|uniref:urease accessory protein UreF n=1 Tax=uncultured Jatrophihabitans sp. TaxID=1610747 RepID=UPI0035C95C18